VSSARSPAASPAAAPTNDARQAELAVPDFAVTVPMFLDGAHEATARGLRDIAPRFSILDHDASRAVALLKDSTLFHLLIPADDGGCEVEPHRRDKVDVRTLCLIREALGYVSPMADSIFAVQGLGSHPFVLARDGEHANDRAQVLAEVARGDRIGAFALTEPEAGSDVASMRATARREGDAWLLSGEKVFISNTGIADHYVVFANADVSLGKKGISAFMVERSAPGLVLEPVPMSVPHPLGRVVMKDAKARAMIGSIGQGLRLALGTLDVFRTSVGAAACGMARRALDETISRVRTRVQFGKPLAEQPLVRAKLADMATQLDAARLLVYRAAWEKDHDAGRGRTVMSVAMAKMFATEAAQAVIDDAVQLHGGLGVTLGSVVEQLYRDIRPLRIYEGTTEIQKLIIGGALAGTAE
jgi:acyl-CoA dehydrogenase